MMVAVDRRDHRHGGLLASLLPVPAPGEDAVILIAGTRCKNVVEVKRQPCPPLITGYLLEMHKAADK